MAGGTTAGVGGFLLPSEVCKLTRMKEFVGSGLLAVLLVLASSGDTCRLGGREYPSDVMVCSGGLAVVCQNGTWQTVANIKALFGPSPIYP